MEYNDIAGKRFGKLIVQKYCHSDFKSNYKRPIYVHFYNCICDCGKEIKTDRHRLVNNLKTDCGCKKSGKYRNDIIGKTFSNLTVKTYVGSEIKKYDNGSSKKTHYYICECKCGNKIKLNRNNIVNSHTMSCGCLRKRKGKNNLGWKGFEDISGRYWGHIKNGAKQRGFSFNIIIQDGWKQFIKQNKCCALTGVELNFLASKGSYSNQTASLDRIDCSRGYEKDNIQWVHKDINLLRSNFSLDHFIKLCKLVAFYEK